MHGLLRENNDEGSLQHFFFSANGQYNHHRHVITVAEMQDFFLNFQSKNTV